MRNLTVLLTALSAMVLMVPLKSMAQPQTTPPEKTIANLNTALEGEANAANRYQAFARKADEEGYHQVSKLFRAIATSESIHRRNHEKVIRDLGGQVKPFEVKPAKVASTSENLKGLISNENKEESEMYPQYIQQARADHAEAAVRSFTFAQNAELQHEKLLKNAKANLGRNKEVNYYVNATSGATTEAPAGSHMTAKGTGPGKLIEIQ